MENDDSKASLMESKPDFGVLGSSYIERDAMTRKMVRLLPAAAAAVVIFVLLLLFSLPSFTPPGDYKSEFDLDLVDWSYGVIIDAGSTGSRLFLYRWQTLSEDKLIDMHPVLDRSNKPVVKKVSPGLSSFADAPNNATGYMKPLFDYVIDYVPESKRAYTPIFIFATAGMRLLPLSAQEAILKNLHTNLPLITPMQVIPENIRVIQGKWEGIYSWIAVNYILGRFNENKSHASRKATVGMADMGGASVQVAFEVNEQDQNQGENYETINLGCNNDDDTYKYRLFVTTFLGYGVNEGLRMYEQTLSDGLLTENDTERNFVRDPCLPLNLIKAVNRKNGSQFTRKGFGDWDKCVQKLSKLITVNSNAECLKEKCFLGKVIAPKLSLSSVELYGFSEYWFSLEDVLDLGGQYNYAEVATRSRSFCKLKWSNIHTKFLMNIYPNANEDRLRSQCFKSAWITAVLHAGFSVDQSNNRFQSVLNINGQEVQWALGAMLYHLRYFPLRDSQRNLLQARHRGSRNGARSGSIFAIFIFFAVVLLFMFCMR